MDWPIAECGFTVPLLWGIVILQFVVSQNFVCNYGFA